MSTDAAQQGQSMRSRDNSLTVSRRSSRALSQQTLQEQTFDLGELHTTNDLFGYFLDNTNGLDQLQDVAPAGTATTFLDNYNETQISPVFPVTAQTDGHYQNDVQGQNFHPPNILSPNNDPFLGTQQYGWSEQSHLQANTPYYYAQPHNGREDGFVNQYDGQFQYYAPQNLQKNSGLAAIPSSDGPYLQPTYVRQGPEYMDPGLAYYQQGPYYSQPTGRQTFSPQEQTFAQLGGPRALSNEINSLMSQHHGGTAAPQITSNSKKRSRPSISDETERDTKRSRPSLSDETERDTKQSRPSFSDGTEGYTKRSCPSFSDETERDTKRSCPSFSDEIERGTKRARVESECGSSDEEPSSSEVKTERNKRQRQGSLGSGLSSGSSSVNVKKRPAPRVGQRPQKMDDKPWIRVNSATRGETTRTARIEEEAHEHRNYKEVPLPNGNYWQSGKYEFEYASTKGVHEFRRKKMSARQINEYITRYPSNDLILWLQMTPADSSRRYASPGHSKCLFEKCPKHVWGESGTIDIGHYRIAFDEKYKQHGNKIVDPYDCPGFVHLACMERFLDFEHICQVADVRIDNRYHLPREMHDAKFTMFNRPETYIAEAFLKAARKGKLRKLEIFRDYPIHEPKGRDKPTDFMLVFQLNDMAIKHRSPSQMRQFMNRELTTNILLIHKGDLEIAMTQKKIQSTKHYKEFAYRRGGAKYPYVDKYDEYDVRIKQRMDYYREKFPPNKGSTNKRKRDDEDNTHKTKSRKRARSVFSEGDNGQPELYCEETDDDDEWDTDRHGGPSRGVRSSPRKRARKDYSEDNQSHFVDAYDEDTIEVAQPQPQQQTHPSQEDSKPQQQAYPPQEDSRRVSASHYFPKTILGNPLLALEDYIRPDEDLRESDIDKMIENDRLALQSRPGEARSATAQPASRRTRQASFNAQPVSQSTEFHANEPPAALSSSPTMTRRSPRLASLASHKSD